jgi:hypothetical protein
MDRTASVCASCLTWSPLSSRHTTGRRPHVVARCSSAHARFHPCSRQDLLHALNELLTGPGSFALATTPLATSGYLLSRGRAASSSLPLSARAAGAGASPRGSSSSPRSPTSSARAHAARVPKCVPNSPDRTQRNEAEPRQIARKLRQPDAKLATLKPKVPGSSPGRPTRKPQLIGSFRILGITSWRLLGKWWRVSPDLCTAMSRWRRSPEESRPPQPRKEWNSPRGSGRVGVKGSNW